MDHYKEKTTNHFITEGGFYMFYERNVNQLFFLLSYPIATFQMYNDGMPLLLEAQIGVRLYFSPLCHFVSDMETKNTLPRNSKA
jgi:hypothetical protein